MPPTSSRRVPSPDRADSSRPRSLGTPSRPSTRTPRRLHLLVETCRNTQDTPNPKGIPADLHESRVSCLSVDGNTDRRQRVSGKGESEVCPAHMHVRGTPYSNHFFVQEMGLDARPHTLLHVKRFQQRTTVLKEEYPGCLP